MSEQPDAEEAIRSVADAVTRIVGRVKRAERRSDDARHLTMLSLVAQRGGVRPSDLAAALNRHTSQVSRELRALENDGLIALAAQADDRRTVLVTLTPAGVDHVTKLVDVGLERYATFLAGWPDDDVRTLARLLDRLDEGMDRAAQAAPSVRPAGRPRAGTANHTPDDEGEGR